MLLRSLSRCLKHAGGLPELPLLTQVYEEYLSGRIEAAELLRRGRDIQAAGSHNRHVRLAVRVLTRLTSEHKLQPGLVENPKAHFTSAFLCEVISHNVLDPSIPEIENLGKFITIEERCAKAAECHEAVLEDGRIPRIAEMLLSDPNALKMRLPASKRPRVSTVNFLAFTVG